MSKRTYVHQKASKWAPAPRLADQPFRALPKKSRQQGRRTINPLQFKTLYNGKEVHRRRDDDDSDDEGYGVPRRRSSRNRHEESDRKRARNSRIREIVGSDPEADSSESPPRKFYSSYKPSGYARQRVADKIAALTRSTTSFEDDLVALKVRLRVITKGIEEAEQLRKPGWTQEVRHLEKLRDDLMKQKEELIEKIVEQEVEEERRKARREGVSHQQNARHRPESPAHASRYERERERNDRGAAREYADRREERRVNVEERVYAERRVVREVEERREPAKTVVHKGLRDYEGTVRAPEGLRKPAGYSSEDSTSSTSIGRAPGDEMRQRILLAEQKAAELRRGLAQRASQQSQHERESSLNEETVDSRRVLADVRTHDVPVAVPLNRQRTSQTNQIQESPADAFRTPRAAPPIRVQTQNLETRRVVDGNNPLGTVDETVPGSYTGTATFPFAHAAMARRTVSNFPRLRLSEAAKATGYMESCVRIIGKKVRKTRESAMVPGEQTTRGGEGDEWGRVQGEGQTEHPHSVLSLLSGADNVTSIFYRTSSRDGEEEALREENIFGDDDHVAMEALRDCQAGIFENHAENGNHNLNLTQSSNGNMESAWNGPEWTAPATPPLERMFNRTVHTMDRDMIDRNQRDFRAGVTAAVVPSQSTPTLQTSKLTSVGPGFSTILFAEIDANSTHQQCVPVQPTDDRMSWIEEDKGIGERVPRFEREEEMMEEPADDNDDCSSGYPPSASDGSSRGFSSSKSQSFHFDMSFSGTDIPFETDVVAPAGRTGNNNVQSRPAVTSRRDHRVDESMAFLRQPPLMSQSQIQMSQSQMSQMGTQQMSQMQQRQGPFDWFNKYTIDEEFAVGRVVQQEEDDDDDESVFRM